MRRLTALRCECVIGSRDTPMLLRQARPLTSLQASLNTVDDTQKLETRYLRRTVITNIITYITINRIFMSEFEENNCTDVILDVRQTRSGCTCIA